MRLYPYLRKVAVSLTQWQAMARVTVMTMALALVTPKVTLSPNP
jgi:hypothetical protein